MSFAINPLGTGAAEVVGLDCSVPFYPDIFHTVKHEFLDNPVLVFRDQTLSASQLAAFGRQFGRLERYGNSSSFAGSGGTMVLRQTNARETPDQMLYQSPDNPDVLIMTNENRKGLPFIGVVDNAEMWHSDASHKAEPCQAIVVHVTRNPALGGDTEFCDMRAVYDALSSDTKTTLDGCLTLHHWSKSLNPRFTAMLYANAREEGNRIARIIPPLAQPAVRTHPESGRSSLYISPHFTIRIDGIPQNLSDALLAQLYEFADNPRFHYRHEWRENDLVIWDNRCLNHRVRSYSAHDIRCRHRVTVAGDQPFFRPSAIAA